ncbi:MAG: ROK family protein [bacterium]
MSLLGIDVGGTKLAMAVGGRDGAPTHRMRRAIALTGDWRRDLEVLTDDARRLLEEATKAGASPLERIGVSVPGPLDREAGLLLNPPNLPGWSEVPVGSVLEAAFGVETRVENDANAAALAEWHFGAGRLQRDSLVYLTMSTGVGGGLVLGGRLHRGAHGGAGELGHAAVELPGIVCACGLQGCLEAYVGGNAWRDRLRRVTPDESDVLARAGGAKESIRPEHLVEAARTGDAFALREMSRWLDYLSRGLATLVMTLEPEVIVLGTIAVAAGEELCFAPLRERVAARLWPHQAARLSIVPAALGEDLPYRAGLAVALEGEASEPDAGAR